MTSFFRSTGLSLVCLGFLGLTGCSEDNEANLNKGAKTADAPVHEQPQTQEEYFKQQAKNDMAKKGGTYQTKGKSAPAAATPKAK